MKSLHPFSQTEKTKALTIKANHQLISAQTMQLEFVLSGDLDSVRWPEASTPQRQDKLWEHTCLEAFFQTTASEKGYTEINGSPRGSWNVYKFDSYRHGMRPSLSTQVKLIEHSMDAKEARFLFEIHESNEIQLTTLGLSAVIEFNDGSISYWALAHPAKEADFHDAQAWTGLSTH